MIEAVRFASAFFGKGQFMASEWSKEGSAYVLRQNLEAGYYQPLDPPQRVKAGEWASVRSKRKRTEICRLEQSACQCRQPGGEAASTNHWTIVPQGNAHGEVEL